jgi:diadenosine hexaphosphate hydrolase (ATP-forming)
LKETESAGGIILNEKGEVLLVEQRHGVWSLPKGHLEGSETPLEAALREIDEETGIEKPEFKKELGCYTRYKIAKDGGDDHGELKTLHFFLFTTTEVKTKPKDRTIAGIRWFKPKDVSHRLTHPKDREFFEAVLPIIQKHS